MDYSIETEINKKWYPLVIVKDNYQRQRKHKLNALIETKKIRVNIVKTNGDKAAGIYEIRCY